MADRIDVPVRVQQLAASLSKPKPMRRGSLSERLVKCSKPGCACARDPKARHGPYFSLTRAVAGKTQSRFLSTEQAETARRQIDAAQEFRNDVQAYRDACEQWADGLLERPAEAAPEGGEKGGFKRPSKPKSPRKSKPS